MKILSTTNSVDLAKKIANRILCEYINTDVTRFNDLELRIQIEKNLNSEEAVIISSISSPANDHLMELLLIADAAKNAHASKITAIITYFGYGRQDRISYNYSPISAKLVAGLIEAAGIDKIITLDLHSTSISDFFNIEHYNITSLPLFIDDIKKIPNCMIISPDEGGIFRAQEYASKLNLDLAYIDKIRDENNICHMNNISQNVINKNCVIIDDIIDSASTICKASQLLMQKGATSVCAYITHGVLSKDAIKKIEDSSLTKITITNSIVNNITSNKFQILDIEPLFSSKPTPTI
ncbi:Ribose-phosphate pyrophosphokinase [Candidatus Arcanobacter lacustris]|uniref:ribose-phosphate diphosphokinase n=1 Tax=Candidatus Arcanibacter lacustris TaxID=1607817 RepID=A0A0F5MQ80_9RICK|nr:Ribose-phosphate pyrophosphokinase [Candidatus Arcanobacter lacustris]